MKALRLLRKAMQRGKTSQIERAISRATRRPASLIESVVLAAKALIKQLWWHQGGTRPADRGFSNPKAVARGEIIGSAHTGYASRPYDNSIEACERRLAAELGRRKGDTAPIPVVTMTTASRRRATPKTGF